MLDVKIDTTVNNWALSMALEPGGTKLSLAKWMEAEGESASPALFKVQIHADHQPQSSLGDARIASHLRGKIVSLW